MTPIATKPAQAFSYTQQGQSGQRDGAKASQLKPHLMPREPDEWRCLSEKWVCHTFELAQAHQIGCCC